MANADLLFSLPANGSANLLFGETAAPPATDIVLSGAFAAMSFTAVVAPTADATVSGTFPALTATIAAQYESRASRPTVGETACAHQVAVSEITGPAAAHQSAIRLQPSIATRWSPAQAALAGVESRLPGRLIRSHSRIGAHHAAALRAGNRVASASQDALRDCRLARRTGFSEALHAHLARRVPSQDALHGVRPSRTARHAEALKITAGWGWHNQRGAALIKGWQTDYENAMRPPAGQWTIPSVPPGPNTCYPPGGNLVFRWPLIGGNLLFVCDNWVSPDVGPVASIVIPIRRIYMQTNAISVVVADTGQPIVTRNLRLSLDADSWVWGWSAVVNADQLGVLSPSGGGQVELIATLNGTAFRLAVERIRRDRTFGKASLSISGRGRAAWLADPYADVVTRTNTEARTAQQLMADALTENGVSIGWSLDWQITDWLVPAGAWSHTGTAMEACLTIAAAAGAYIQAHRTNQELRILPRYPSVPWSWGSVTPDIQIPEDVCVTEGIEWIDKPAYNTVFISGQEGGILAHVTRGGTSGDKPAPMITDPLVGHADAGRQRGTAILSDTGRQKLISLSLPVLPETGIIVPGKFVRYTEGGTQHIGLTRAVEVGPEFPKLRQTITVESHVL